MAQHKVICSVHLCFAPRFPARSRTHTASLIQASSDITQQSVIKAQTYLKVLELNSCSNFKKCSWPETNKEDSNGRIANLEFATKLLTHSTLTVLQPRHSLGLGHTPPPPPSPPGCHQQIISPHSLAVYPQNQAKDSICLQAFCSDCRQWL